MKEIGYTADPMNAGIYLGFARLGSEVYKAVVSIGWNPYFENKEKTVVSVSNLSEVFNIKLLFY